MLLEEFESTAVLGGAKDERCALAVLAVLAMLGVDVDWMR